MSAPLLVGAPVLVVGVLLSVLWHGQSRRAVTELADRNIEKIHALAATKVADTLSVPVRVCRVNAHLVERGALDPDDLASWRPTLVNQLGAFDMLSAIVWGGADGRSAWISRYSDGAVYWALKDDGDAGEMLEWRLDGEGRPVEGSRNSFEFDLSVRPWFVTPREAGVPVWSDPFVWLGGGGVPTLGISYGIPLYDDAGALIGVVDADFSLNDLSAFLRTVEVGKTGFAVMATPDARLLAASNDTPIVTEGGERVDAYSSPDPLVVAAANAIGDAESVLGGHAEIEVDGVVYYFRASPIGREVGLDWTLATIVPESDFTGRIDRDLRRSWLTSLAAVLVAVGVGLVAAHWLVSPLVTLVRAVRRIGQGDLETRVAVRHAPEYTRLADEINEMTLGLQDRMRMRESLSLAMEVQRNLLPATEPSVAGLDIAAHSTYCDETGGDYYDFLDVSDADAETSVVALGDVMGHGVAAAMLMATARGILRSRCAVPGSLSDFLRHLNEMLVPDTGGERFMTMLLLTIAPTRGEIRWASAGHGPPIIYDAPSDSFPELEPGGIPLGILEGETFEERLETGMHSGTLILAATDGLWETKGEGDELYGMDRLRALIRANAHRPAAEISEAIRDALAEFRGPAAPDDDLTFVIVKVI